jgi:hypothetical protein
LKVSKKTQEETPFYIYYWQEGERQGARALAALCGAERERERGEGGEREKADAWMKSEAEVMR